MTKIGNALKRFLSVSLCAAVTCGCAVFGGTFVSAATVIEQEDNDSFSTAFSISAGDTVSGNITADDVTDFYKLDLSTSGELTIETNADIERVNFHLYDADGNQIIKRSGYYDGYKWNDTTHKIVRSETVDLTKSVYYICYEKYEDCIGSYTIKSTFNSAGETFSEPAGGNDNNMESAHSIAFSKKYTGQLAYNDDKDFYKITLSSSGLVTFDLTAYNMERIDFDVYDADGSQVIDRSGYYDDYEWNSTTKKISESDSFYLNKGTYYMCYSKYDGLSGKYEINVKFKSSGETFAETGFGTDNSMETANSIKLGTTYKGLINSMDDRDFYKFTLNGTATLIVKVGGTIENVSFYIYDSNGSTIYDKGNWSNRLRIQDTSKKIVFKDTIMLNKGTYYVCFQKYDKNYGEYDFRIAQPEVTSVKLNKSSVSINKGKTTTLSAILNPTNAVNKSVKWSTSNKKVATVDSKGKVKAVAKGTATITATTSNGKKATCKVTVKIPATKVKLNKTKATLKAGKTLTLKATMTPKNTTDKLIWTSSNKKVATVKNGKITAKKAGKTTITVKTTSGKKATCKITVKKK